MRTKLDSLSILSASSAEVSLSNSGSNWGDKSKSGSSVGSNTFGETTLGTNTVGTTALVSTMASQTLDSNSSESLIRTGRGSWKKQNSVSGLVLAKASESFESLDRDAGVSKEYDDNPLDSNTSNDTDSEYSASDSIYSIRESEDEDEFTLFQSTAASSCSYISNLWNKLVTPKGADKPVEDDRDDVDDESESSEIPEETVTDRLRTTLVPQCRPDELWGAEELHGRTTELHELISKQKWHVIRRRLQLLTEFCEEVPKEQRYKDKLETMIRQVDEHGRTPLSLACGKSSAPCDIIQTIIDAYPLCASAHDRNENLPMHHFCHSYELSNVEILDEERKVLNMLHSTAPKGIESVNSYGNTPIHIYLEHRVGDHMRRGTLDVVLKLLEIYPNAVFIANKGGSMPMHQIGKASNKKGTKKAKKDDSGIEDVGNVIGIMHKANPDAIKTKNNLGATPFFNAVIYDAHVEIWKGLLARFPGAVLVDNGHGVTPLSAHWNMFVSLKAKKKYLHLSDEEEKEAGRKIDQNRKSMSKIKSLQSLRSKAPTSLVDFWDKMELMIRAVSSNNVSNKNRTWRILHAICSISECPSDALKFALQMYSHQVEEADENENLPLHIAAGTGDVFGTRRQSQNVHSMITRLISVYDNAAREFNAQGQLPLHVALEHGKTWTYGVESILNANPGAARMRDAVTGMYPFMMAATNKGDPAVVPNHQQSSEETIRRKTEELDTVYELLRAAPELISVDKARESDDVKMQKKNYELLKAKANLTRHCHDMEENTTKLKEDLEEKERKVNSLQKELDKLKAEMKKKEKEHRRNRSKDSSKRSPRKSKTKKSSTSAASIRTSTTNEETPKGSKTTENALPEAPTIPTTPTSVTSPRKWKREQMTKFFKKKS